MNSPEPSVTKMAGLLGQARVSFDWIDLFAVPIAICIMETQPLALLLTFGAMTYVSESAAAPLEEGSITLLLLGLHWWERAVSAIPQRRLSLMGARLLGLFLAVAITVSTHIAMLNDTPTLVFTIALITGFWYIGMYRVQTGPSDEYVLTSFKIGLGVLLGVLIFTLLNFRPVVPQVLHDELTRALPTFFLSGLIGLSFTRIMIIRKENARSAQRSTQGDPTRVWLMILTLAWILVMSSTFAFEAFGFQPLVAAATFLWNGLGIVINWLLLLLTHLFNFTTGLFLSTPQIPLPHLPPSSNDRRPSPQPVLTEILILLVRLILLGVLLYILFFILRAILRRLYRTPEDESEEEIRESLSLQTILKERREKQRKHARKTGTLAALEPLDPNSARARYRELLQALAWNKEELSRRVNETPAEYETRLLTLLKKAPPLEARGDGTPPDPALLDALTSAYIQERYGGKHPHLEHDAYMPAWIPRFVRRLGVSRGSTTRDKRVRV